MRIADIMMNSVANGPGIRDVIFVQGCDHHCPGCHNPQTWNKGGGKLLSACGILNQLKQSDNNVTISGGEPLDQYLNVQRLCNMLHVLQNKTMWVYTGYTYEQIPHTWLVNLQASGVECIVDGEFKQELKNLSLKFRGSGNQRIIDLKKSLLKGEVVLWEE